MRNNPLQEHTWSVEARVRIHFDQIQIEINIEHEVKAHELECVIIIRILATTDSFRTFIGSVDCAAGSLEHVGDAFLDLWHDLLKEADTLVSLKVLIKVLVADFVGRFVLSVICRHLLHSIIR